MAHKKIPTSFDVGILADLSAFLHSLNWRVFFMGDHAICHPSQMCPRQIAQSTISFYSGAAQPLFWIKLISMPKSLTRWSAFGIHFSITILISLGLLSLIIFSWYPGVFFQVGGWQGIRLVAGVNLVLGPLLTLIVFDATKKFINLDLAIIAILQIIALFAGTWVIHNERPITQVLADDGIYILSLADYKNAGLAKDTKFEAFAGSTPKPIYIDLPDNTVAIQTIKFSTEFMDHRPIIYRTDLYRELSESAKQALSWRLTKFKYDQPKDCYWLPLYSTHLEAQACLNLKAGVVEIQETQRHANPS